MASGDFHERRAGGSRVAALVAVIDACPHPGLIAVVHGQYAIAEVTLNRVKSKHYPNTICKVVHQKNWDKIRKRYVSAFSWTELDFAVNVNSKAWKRAMYIAEQAYYNSPKPRVKGALFYHANYIKPSWSRKKKVIAKIGKHIFY